MKHKRHVLFFGSRPEVVKLSPLILEMQKRKWDFKIVYSGQHKDYNMFLEFFAEFNLPKPDYKYEGEFEVQPVKVWLKKLLKKIKADFLIVNGDTDTAFTGALAGYEIGIPVIHRESGVRSFDRNMQEEKNRIIIDKLASIHFVPCKEAMENLKEENIKNCYLVGNTLVDSIKDIKMKYYFVQYSEKEKFILFTFHRKENLTVDILNNVFTNLDKFKRNICFPCHPNTWNFIKHNNIKYSNRITIISPTTYYDLISLIDKAILVLTDSGGISEECAILKTPCVTLRKTTDRPELCKIGANVLINPKTKKWPRFKFAKKWKQPYGKDVAFKICNVLEGI